MDLLLPAVAHCQDKHLLLLDHLHSHDRPQEDSLSRCRCLPRLVVHMLERLLRLDSHLDRMLRHLGKDKDSRLRPHRMWVEVHMLLLLANNSSSSLVGCMLLLLVLVLELGLHNLLQVLALEAWQVDLHLQVPGVHKLRLPLVFKSRDLLRQSIVSLELAFLC